jgi:TPR repeat protein
MRFPLLSSLVATVALAQPAPAPPAAPKVTLADLEKACAKGDLVSCTDYGFNLENPDPEKAVAVYRAACTKGALPACSNLALMLRDARGAPKGLPEAEKVAKKACDGGNAPGCLHLALVKDAANDFAGATLAYESACKLKVFPACTNHAINVLKGVGVKKDEKRAMELLEKSCGESVKKGALYPSLRACVVLGQIYEQGVLVAANKDAAKRLYKLACFGGLEEGCERLGNGPKNKHDDGHNH